MTKIPIIAKIPIRPVNVPMMIRLDSPDQSSITIGPPFPSVHLGKITGWSHWFVHTIGWCFWCPIVKWESQYGWSTSWRAVRLVWSVVQCVWDLETPKQGGHHGTNFARSTQFYYVHSTFRKNQPVSVLKWKVSIFDAFWWISANLDISACKNYL